jgi:glycosyltransferase involved in cell wall biosynthesis
MSFGKTTQLSISVVIPVYNGGDSFRRCLARLAEASPAPLEVIVVSDGDTDGSGTLAEEWGATVVRLPVSGGPAKARNVGARMAQGDIIFFVDADVEIRPDTIGQVAIAFERDPELAALIGSYDDAPGATNFLSQYRNLLHHYVHQTGQQTAFTFWGACGGIRREIFLAVDGFDERYRQPCIEDIELGYRLRQTGHKIELHKTIQVKHLKRWEVLSMLRADIFYRALPWTALLLQQRQMANDLNLQMSSRISVLLVFTAILTLAATYWNPMFLGLTLISLLALLALNWSVYRFFYHKRGLLFALRVIPWHWLYYSYSGLSFAVGLVRHWMRSIAPRPFQTQSSH